jgi:microcystin-dependent protein
MSQAKYNDKMLGSLKLYNNNIDRWVHVRVNEIGDLKYSARSQDHNEWMICDGRSISREEYSYLFEVIGTSFGSADAFTFKIPDARGRVPGIVGDGSGLASRNLGDKLGSETTTLAINNLPSHTHTGTTESAGAHSHSYIRPTDNVSVTEIGGSQAAQFDNMTTQTTSSVGDHVHNFTTDSTGMNESFSQFQPTLFVGNLFICSNIIV